MGLWEITSRSYKQTVPSLPFHSTILYSYQAYMKIEWAVPHLCWPLVLPVYCLSLGLFHSLANLIDV